jgi:hypothetical protein
MASGAVVSPVLLGCAFAAVSGAVAADLARGELPTHSVVLGAVALVVAALSRRLARGVVAALPAVAGALAVQPVLHAATHAGRPAGLPHALAHGATAGVQIAVPALVVVAAALATQLLWLVVVAVRARRRVPARPTPPRTLLRLPPLVPSAPLLCRCGWAVSAARRGPPAGYAH